MRAWAKRALSVSGGTPETAGGTPTLRDAHASGSGAQNRIARTNPSAYNDPVLPRILKSLAAVLALYAPAESAERLPQKPGSHTIQFTDSAVQSSGEEVKARLSAAEDPKPFEIAKEKFQLVIPQNYQPREAWGLFIWISASHAPSIPPEWHTVLAARKLLFVGAHQSGNPRDIFDRVRMAVDANVAMRSHYRIDERRVYVSGFSGGARVASMIGVAFADLFTGTIPFMGVNFYTELPAGGGKEFGISYLPNEQVLEIAKKRCRFVLVTGEKDFNRINTRAAEEHGFRKEGFANVLCLEVPGLGHAMPPAQWLEQGLGFLDGPGKGP
jgi:predicted esterase